MQRNESWHAAIRQQLDCLGATFDAAQHQWRGAAMGSLSGLWLRSEAQWLKSSLLAPLDTNKRPARSFAG